VKEWCVRWNILGRSTFHNGYLWSHRSFSQRRYQIKYKNARFSSFLSDSVTCEWCSTSSVQCLQTTCSFRLQTFRFSFHCRNFGTEIRTFSSATSKFPRILWYSVFATWHIYIMYVNGLQWIKWQGEEEFKVTHDHVLKSPLLVLILEWNLEVRMLYDSTVTRSSNHGRTLINWNVFKFYTGCFSVESEDLIKNYFGMPIFFSKPYDKVTLQARRKD
jgi:uncharacterized membrane protein